MTFRSRFLRLWLILLLGLSFLSTAVYFIVFAAEENPFQEQFSWDFTDPELTAGSTPIRALHFSELKDCIDARRIAGGMSAYSYSFPAAELSGDNSIRAAHMNELRAALNDLYVTQYGSQYALHFSNDPIEAGVTPISVRHIDELRRMCAPPPSPSISLWAEPASVLNGGNTTVHWVVQNSELGCTASNDQGRGDWNGSKDATENQENTQVLTAITADTTLTLTCENNNPAPDNSASKSITISLLPPIISSFTATPNPVASGQNVAVSWNVLYADTCTASSAQGIGGWSGNVAATNGNHTLNSVGPISQHSTLSLSCSNAGGTTVSTLLVSLNGPVDGVCGDAATTYSNSDTSWGGASFCSAGTASPVSPVFPDPDSTATWQCLGQNNGDNISCSATRGNQPTPPLIEFNLTADTQISSASGTVLRRGGTSDSGGTASWTVANAASCTLSYPHGSESINTAIITGFRRFNGKTEPFNDGFYSLSCTSPSGISSSRQIYLQTINDVVLTAGSTSLGGSATVSWSSFGTSCYGTGSGGPSNWSDWFGSLPGNGSVTLNNIPGNVSLNISCENSTYGYISSASAMIVVN